MTHWQIRQTFCTQFSLHQMISDFADYELFKFPASKVGFEWFNSVADVKQAFMNTFNAFYGNNKNIKWFLVKILFQRREWKQNKLVLNYSKKHHKKISYILRINCQVCSNSILYANIQGLPGLTLLQINYYHIHTENKEKYLDFIINRSKNYLSRTKVMFIKVIHDDYSRQSVTDEDLVQFYVDHLARFKENVKFLIMQRKFGIDRQRYNSIFDLAHKEYMTDFEELVATLQKYGYSYSYLPANLINRNSSQLSDQTLQNEEALNLEDQRDSANPTLPNVFIMSTPQMKAKFHLFGEYVGFDLTFSVISERTAYDREYLIGVFMSTNNMKKIVPYAVVVTNSQSVYAYSFIFRQFFKMMKKVPDYVITDEEGAMHHALVNLKKEGIFTGKHLLDSFHILRKFRKCGPDSQTFQFLRKLIHAKDKIEYRRIFRQTIHQLTDEKELKIFRNFDLNSEYYCYSQIDPKYVGIGVSNSHNEYLNNLIKSKVPRATGFTKVMRIMLDLIENRLSFSEIHEEYKPMAKSLNISLFEDLKRRISDKFYYYLVKETSLGPPLKLMSLQEESERNFKQTPQDLIPRDHYYVIQDGKIYYVFKETKGESVKWSCLCTLEERSGHLCCHIFKVLQKTNESVNNNMSKRWLIDVSTTDKTQFDKQLSHVKLKKNIERKLLFGMDVKIKRTAHIENILKQKIEDAKETSQTKKNDCKSTHENDPK